jgi:hypothetical protein
MLNRSHNFNSTHDRTKKNSVITIKTRSMGGSFNQPILSNMKPRKEAIKIGLGGIKIA